jgi:hypothetical protein
MSQARRSCRPWRHGGALAGFLLAGLVLAGLPSPAAADESRALSLTIYNRDLGLVRDVRSLSIAAGTDWVDFRDVPERIDPTSVHLKPVDGEPLAVLEQNYRYDLVSSEKILERYLDAEIKVILEEGRLYEGRLLSAGGRHLVLGGMQPEEGLTILTREKITDIQFPALPEGLITRPTLAWLLSAERGGARQVEVSYLTGGFDWHAEYVAVVDQEDSAMDLSGWVSIDNHSGATYPQADLQLVAGDVHRVPAPGRPAKGRGAMEMMAAPQAAGFEEESFFEYHLYTLGRQTTLRDRETKQLALFAPADCEVAKRYESNPRRDGAKVRVVLETTNSRAAGLGMPLPAGTVRVYKRDRRERLQFIGEDRIDHTPRDEKLRVLIGNAFDLVVERTELATRRIGPRDREIDIEIEVRNRKEDDAVDVLIQEDLYGYWQVLRASAPYEQKSSTRIEFTVPVAAGETATVRYTVRFTS